MLKLCFWRVFLWGEGGKRYSVFGYSVFGNPASLMLLGTRSVIGRRRRRAEGGGLCAYVPLCILMYSYVFFNSCGSETGDRKAVGGGEVFGIR